MEEREEVSNEEVAVGNLTVPKGVKAISIISYVGSLIALLMGIFFIALSLIVSMVNSANLLNQLAGNLFLVVKNFAVLIGIALIIFSVVNSWIYVYLWKGRNWARIVAIVFSGILFFVFLSLIIFLNWGNLFYIIGLGYNLFIFLYLILSKNVKNAFNHQTVSE